MIYLLLPLEVVDIFEALLNRGYPRRSGSTRVSWSELKDIFKIFKTFSLSKVDFCYDADLLSNAPCHALQQLTLKALPDKIQNK